MCSAPQALSITTLLIAFQLYFDPVVGGKQQVDNASPLIQYQGAWQTFATPGDGDLEDTLAFSQDNLDTAILHFTGTSVTVYGALKPVGTWNMHSAYYLDDAPAVGFLPNPVVASEKHQVVFFSSGTLANGSHKLSIVNMGQQFWFDYIVVESTIATTRLPDIPLGSPTHSLTSRVTALASSLLIPPSTPSSTSSTTTPIAPTVTPPPSTHTSTPSTSSASFAPPPSSLPNSTSENATSSRLTVTPGPSSSAAQPEPNSAATLSLPTSSSLVASSPSQLGASSSISATATATATTRGATLSLGEVIGIAAGGAALVLVLALAMFWMWRRHRRIAARTAVSPFVADFSDTATLDPPIYLPSEKGSVLASPQRQSLAIQIPSRQMLVITHADSSSRGGIWTDYQSQYLSSIPSVSGYNASENTVEKAVKEDRERRARRRGLVHAEERSGMPF